MTPKFFGPSTLPRPIGKTDRSSLGWTFKLGRIAGITIQLHATFLLLAAWVVFSNLVKGHGLKTTGTALLLLACVFGTIVLHELGHALMARRFGIRTRDITLLPIGGVGRLEHMPDKAGQELLIALAGPAVNVVLALLLVGVMIPIGAPLNPPATDALGSHLLTQWLWLNIGLAVFNLIPAFPMDGGRVLRALLALRMGYDRATAIAARLGRGVAIVFGVLGLFYNPVLVLIALFVWIGSQQEAVMVHLKTALTGIPVAKAMITDFHTLQLQDTLAKAATLTMAGFQSDFPVLCDGAVVGVLSRGELLRALATQGPDAPVQRAMNTEFATISSSEPVERAFERLSAVRDPILVVTEDDRIVGLLVPDHVTELLMIGEALSAQSAETTSSPAPVRTHFAT